MNMKLKAASVYSLVILVIVLTVCNLVLIVKLSEERTAQRIETEKKVQELHLQIANIPSIKPVDGYTPIKGKDYFDGQKGDKGDSIKGDTGESAYQIAVRHGFTGSESTWLDSLKPKDGLTPIVKCNIQKNRWEFRYTNDDVFRVLSGVAIPCTISTVGF